MDNGTLPAEVEGENICIGKKCPDGKFCLEDKKFPEGYKCCRNKRCVVKCKDPGLVENASRIPDPRKFKPNETVQFTCNKGSLHTVTCQDDGTWSGPLPKCVKIGGEYRDMVTTGKLESTTSSTKAEAAGVDGAVVAFAFLLPLLVLALAAVLFFRYKGRTRQRLSWHCREGSHPVVYENVFPTMPENLEENAIAIKDFAQYVAVRHNYADRLFREEFEEIQNQCTSGFSCETSLLDENQEKNRYTNIVAYDHTRVHLNRGKKHRRSSSMRCSDYINANFVSSYKQPKAYIACQGPLPETFNDFWRMIWENNVSVIVMITNLVEKGRRKCDRYWPQDGREQYKHISVALRDVDVYANYTVRTFQIRDTKQSKRRSYTNERRILQFHYTQWPDHGTPEYILPLLTFIRRSSEANSIDSAPIVVHCSAGVGRTGAYIVLHSMIQMALKMGKININKFLRFIRTQRNHLVQTEDQYIFLHDALLCYFTCGNTECPAQQLKVYMQNLLTKPIQNEKQAKQNGVNTANSMNLQLEAGPTENPTGMERQFMVIARHVVRDIDYDFAVRSVNQSKNRSNGILPVFRSRVPLHYRMGNEGSDYINASFTQGYRNGKKFIITQLPMATTRKDFWSLVWDHNCAVIITIRDKDWDDSSDIYWPTGEDQITCPLFNVSTGLKSQETVNLGADVSVTVRAFVLEATKDDYVLAVTQLDLSGWPTIDELSPEFGRLLNFVVSHTEGKDGSVVVQDRYGGIAAGQLVCAHSLHQQLANENAIDVFQTVRVAYQMRPGIFKSHKDLHFLYKALLLQTNPTLFQNHDTPHDKVNNSTLKEHKFPQDPDLTDTAPLLGGGDENVDFKEKSTENVPSLTPPDQDFQNAISEATKEENCDNHSHYDLLNDVAEETKLVEDVCSSKEKNDEVLVIVEKDDEVETKETTFEIQSDLDDSVTSGTAKLIK